MLEGKVGCLRRRRGTVFISGLVVCGEDGVGLAMVGGRAEESSSRGIFEQVSKVLQACSNEPCLPACLPPSFLHQLAPKRYLYSVPYSVGT